jgi:hypothetical protein
MCVEKGGDMKQSFSDGRGGDDRYERTKGKDRKEETKVVYFLITR